jgi:hypothetical protein
MPGGRRAGDLDGTLRAGRTPGSLEEGGSREGPTLQRTRATRGTLREITAPHLLPPLGHGQGLPRRGWRGVGQKMTALRSGTGFPPIGEKAVGAEADKAGREDMEQEAVEKGLGV